MWTFWNWYVILMYSFGNGNIQFIRISCQIKWLSNKKFAKIANDSVMMSKFNLCCSQVPLHLCIYYIH